MFKFLSAQHVNSESSMLASGDTLVPENRTYLFGYKRTDQQNTISSTTSKKTCKAMSRSTNCFNIWNKNTTKYNKTITAQED